MKTTLGIAATVALSLGLIIVPGIGHAADDGSPSSQTVTCGKGKVYDKKKQMCVDAQSGIIDDKALRQQAHALAKSGQPHLALELLDLAVHQDDPKILNIRGYATRLAGKVDAGISFYQQALALDADNVLVREYLGEAYVTKGEMKLAQIQLSEIERLCGADCEEYRALKKVIREAGGA